MSWHIRIANVQTYVVSWNTAPNYYIVATHICNSDSVVVRTYVDHVITVACDSDVNASRMVDSVSRTVLWTGAAILRQLTIVCLVTDRHKASRQDSAQNHPISVQQETDYSKKFVWTPCIWACRVTKPKKCHTNDSGFVRRRLSLRVWH